MANDSLGFLVALAIIGAFLWLVWETMKDQTDNIPIERAAMMDSVEAAEAIDPRGEGSIAPNLDVSNQTTDAYQTWIEGAMN